MILPAVALPCRLGIPCALDALERALTAARPLPPAEEQPAWALRWGEALYAAPSRPLELVGPTAADAVRRFAEEHRAGV